MQINKVFKAVLILTLCALLAVSAAACGEKAATETAATTAADTAAATAQTSTEAQTAAEAQAETQAKAEEKNETTADQGDSPLIGSWTYDEGGFTYTFNADGTGEYDFFGEVMSFTYTDNGDSIEILYADVDGPSAFDYSIDGNTLIIKDSFGTDVKYIKQ